MLPPHPTAEPLSHPHHRDEVVHGRAPACRAQKFPEAISFNAAFSSSASASSRFNVLFSRSRSFSLLASSAFNPPNWFRHRSYVCSETPSSRQTPATSLPSASSRSAWVSFRTTCSGVCLLLVVIVIKPSCPTHERQDSHSTRINQQGSRHGVQQHRVDGRGAEGQSVPRAADRFLRSVAVRRVPDR